MYRQLILTLKKEESELSYSLEILKWKNCRNPGPRSLADFVTIRKGQENLAEPNFKIQEKRFKLNMSTKGSFLNIQSEKLPVETCFIFIISKKSGMADRSNEPRLPLPWRRSQTFRVVANSKFT